MDHCKILILRLSAVGDVIRTLPAVKALRAHYPSSHITWIVEEPSKTILESQPEIDEVIVLPRKRWTEGMQSIKGVGRTLREVRRFVSGLRKRKFDIVLDFHGLLKSGLLSFVSGAPKRIGFDRKSTKEGNFVFSNVKVVLPESKVSRFERNFALLKGLGLDVKTFDTRIHVPEKDREGVEAHFVEWSTRIHRPLIAIHPGTSPKTVYKRWMPEQYAQLSDRLIRELKATVLFTWGADELEWVQNIQKEMKETSLLGPRTESLTALGEVFSRCDAYIGGDTGPMHVASLMGIPVVVIYGPTDPIVNEPFGRHKKVRREVGCNPCRNRSCRKLSCLKMVKVDDVFKAAKEVLSISD